MYKIIPIFLFLVITVSYAQEPPNIYFAKQKLISYYDSGEYYHDVRSAISNAQSCLNAYAPKDTRGAKKPALILDIDETSLTTIKHNHKLTFGVSKEEFEAIVTKANAPAIPATLALYNFAKAHGMAVFFVSGRAEAWRAATVKNLKEVGYNNWDGLYLRADHYHPKTIVPFKSNIRKLLRSKGYDIIGNIGDQESDLAGDKNVKCKFKLPNPYYFIY